ncbi:MAG: ArsR/SmtB family transcription factor [Pontimonas sp.]|jgi:ArsR family transcriptional regulator
MIPISLPVNVAQCAPAGLSAPLARQQAEELTRLLKAIADPTRLQILSLINAQPEGSACVCDLAEAINVSQPTISHHLKTLTSVGLLQREKRGTWAWYSLNQEQWRSLANVVS